MALVTPLHRILLGAPCIPLSEIRGRTSLLLLPGAENHAVTPLRSPPPDPDSVYARRAREAKQQKIAAGRRTGTLNFLPFPAAKQFPD